MRTLLCTLGILMLGFVLLKDCVGGFIVFVLCMMFHKNNIVNDLLRIFVSWELQKVCCSILVVILLIYFLCILLGALGGLWQGKVISKLQRFQLGGPFDTQFWCFGLGIERKFNDGVIFIVGIICKVVLLMFSS